MATVANPLGVDPNQDIMNQRGTYAPTQVDPTPSQLPRPVALPVATGGTTGIPAGPAPNPPPPVGNYQGAVTPSQMLSQNPQLPQHPASVQPGTLDSQYNADQASLAFEISQRYNDVLKNLGYLDPSSGNFIMGRVETEANQQRAELNRNLALAAQEQTLQRQLEGTLFSGRRAQEEARAQHPFVQSLADLDISVPQNLSDLYEQAGNLMTEYTTRQNQLLAAAAQRRALAIMQNPTLPPGTNPPDGTYPPDGTLPPGGTPPGGGGGVPFMAGFTPPLQQVDPFDPSNYWGQKTGV